MKIPRHIVEILPSSPTHKTISSEEGVRISIPRFMKSFKLSAPDSIDELLNVLFSSIGMICW